MRKIAAVILLMVFGSVHSGAQSMIRVKLADGAPFNIAVDGRYFNKRGTSVTVGDLPPGRHLVQVYSVMRNSRGRGREEIIFEKRVHTTGGMVTLLTYDPVNDYIETEEQDVATFNAQRRQPAGGADRQTNMAGGGYRNDNGSQTGNQAYGDAGAGQPLASPVGSLTDAKIDQLKTNVTAKKTDTEKMNFVKGELKDDTYTTAQVSTMMDWFSFESTKEEFAEWAFSATVDKDAYANLEGKFSYKNYQDALDQFLKTK